MAFQLTSQYTPSGDQPGAIDQLVNAVNEGEKAQVLLGVTGSGKTFTIANVIQQVQRPTLILSHNKTLVAQLYGEFRQFFPENAVEYFVSYYDYYQPEAYIATTDTYIEKDLSINDEVEKLRLKTTSSLQSGRRDVIVVATVSCIYGIGNPAEFKESIVRVSQGDQVTRNFLLHRLVEALYARTLTDFRRGTFRVIGDTVEVYPAYADYCYRITFFGDEVEEIEIFDADTGRKTETAEHIAIFPANLYIAPKEILPQIIHEIHEEMDEQVAYFERAGKYMEAKRLKERVNFDIEMIKELGYCSGIENYSRFFDRRKPGSRPFCLIDYFPDDFLLVIDESHVTVPQIGAMYGGDRARKTNLVEFGFRLPSALDNRPLNFDEFQQLAGQTIYVSATPGDYELEQTGGVIVEQVVRPTGLLDPPIEVRPSINQIDDLLDEVDERIKKGERVLATTLTKRMAEELTKYLQKVNIKCRYIHSEVDTLERVEILRDLRLGKIDVLVGVNLLREGLDLPEVSLVAILDADKEGFLRNTRSLTQTAGRAARNVNGLVIMYADKVTESMQRTIDETERRRAKQLSYNAEHGIVPRTVVKSTEEIFKQTSVLEIRGNAPRPYVEDEVVIAAADPVVEYMDKQQLEKAIAASRKKMLAAAKDMDFLEAARLRDEMFGLQKLLDEKFSSAGDDVDK
ncbi:MAG: excinuclease ABC subunit UvrB [Chitinophagales bacterium]|nr:excinuclease ABC subunit UvrB [Chitinophagales bacterium]MCB9021242.1 excinuclease ABC subunit UvrB [Chitinophagales bacterium]HPE96945.1 excinuclease ABC subunit UvrB [Chitinophagales bacterium]HQU38682.1 excinuclease ABC subunit UvrB [Chitinophagales bacterium]HRX23136.1 excinuclease ABC subunit UvrB [Chitinophagales bacterium]